MAESTKIEVWQHLIDAYMPYAMSTILDRALPDVRDGLKPVHRRILYAMYKALITYNKDRAKTSEPIAETMKIHHHGDTSILDAIALMSEQNESLLHPFLDCEGAFGKVYSKDKPSAPRYTYARLNKFAEEFFKDINKNVLHMIGEDKDHMQPVVLSSGFPNILIKNNSGIAVGEACDFPSFNLIEISNATIAYLKDKNINLLNYITGLDFSTGGYLIYNKQSLEDIYNTGKGSIVLRSKYKYDKSNNCIDVYEIPYSTTVDDIIKKITILMKTNKYKGMITDVRDETGFNRETNREEMKITIDVKKNTDIEKLMANLFKDSPLQCSYSANMNCLVDYEPKVLGIKKILDEWLKYRVSCIKKSLEYDIDKKTKELHLLKGLEKILLDIDETIDIIRHSKKAEIKNKLINRFDIDEDQAKNIMSIKLWDINDEYVLEQLKDINTLEQEVADLNSKLNSEEEINNIIISDLIRVRDTYGKPRKTEIIYEDNLPTFQTEELIEDYNCYYAISEQNYLYKYLRKTDTYRLKEGDKILKSESITNKFTLLCFTNQGNLYKLFMHNIPEKAPSEIGHYLPSLIQLEPNEQIISIQATRKYEEYLINCFENNKLVKIPLTSFKTEQKRIKLKNALCIDSKLINQFTITEDIDILIKSSINKVLITNTSQFNAKTSKNSNGDSLIKSKNDSVVELCVPLSSVSIDKLGDIEYYKGKRGAVGSYLRKEDKIELE